MAITRASLTSRTDGYTYEAVKIFMPAGSKQPVVVHYTEHCPPDVAAAFIWLKNRDPERWRDSQQVEHAIGKYTADSLKVIDPKRPIREAGISDLACVKT